MKKEKSQYRKKIFRRWLALSLSVLSLELLTACGDTADDRSLGIDGFVYIAREMELPGEVYIASSSSIRDGYLYYQEDETLMRLPLDRIEDSWSEYSVPVLSCQIQDNVMDYAAGNNGDLYYYRQNRIANAGGLSALADESLLVRQAADGSIVYETDIPLPDAISKLPCDLAVDGEDRAYLLAEGCIYVINASGETVAAISTEEYTQNLTFGNQVQFLTGPGSQVYFLIGSSGETIYKIIADGSYRLEEQSELTRNMSGRFYSSPYGLLCDKADGILYQYRETDSSWHPLLRWTDGNAGSTAGMVLQLSEDCIAACYSTINGSLASMENEDSLYLLTRTAVAELPQKEILVLASMYPSSSLQQSVMEFNQASDQYHILLDIYKGDEAATRLDAAMVSSDPPDLLDISSLDFVKYAEKQALADLSPYLNRSKVIKPEDFLPALLEGYTAGGRLCSIPSSFTLTTVMGRPDQIGSDAGWTMTDVMALSEKYPDCRLINFNSFSYILNYLCSDYILEEYIDWEEGTCRFDSSEFRELILWIWDHSEESGRFPANEERYTSGLVPEDMLLIRKSIFSPYNYALEITKMGGDVTTIIGYPTADGHELHEISVQDALGITSSSRHKEAAWQFMEYFLSQDFLELYAFPSRREALLQLIEEEATPTYQTDENGNIIYINGKPEIKVRMVEYIGEMRTEYRYLEREHADALLNLIDHLDFVPESTQKSTAAAIIREELGSWLSRDKSLEEAADIIQNRIQLLLDENS
ncbi:MAG: extracellular solute-binding protein [Acetatifactor sp.]|nr:extracellular solute-binding protein [Acetatifactor sp.]